MLEANVLFLLFSFHIVKIKAEYQSPDDVMHEMLTLWISVVFYGQYASFWPFYLFYDQNKIKLKYT